MFIEELVFQIRFFVFVTPTKKAVAFPFLKYSIFVYRSSLTDFV